MEFKAALGRVNRKRTCQIKKRALSRFDCFLDDIIKGLLLISHTFHCSGMHFMIKLNILSSNGHV